MQFFSKSNSENGIKICYEVTDKTKLAPFLWLTVYDQFLADCGMETVQVTSLGRTQVSFP